MRPFGKNLRLYHKAHSVEDIAFLTTKPVKMRKLIFSSLLVFFCLQAVSAQYRDNRTGYEGDFFSLEGALELFQDARSLRDFERSLNTQDRWANNLDLDYDGRTDYIRVEHRRQGDFHLVILQAIVGPYDIQDVAVIEIERIGHNDAILQIIGDEDLYGREVYVEPVIGYANSRTGRNTNYGEYVNVFYWPIVQYMFGPQYRQVYVSPYRYQYYPTWWSAWRPVTWNVFRPRIVVYTRRFCVVPRLRVVRAHRFYRPFRAYSYNVVLRSNRVRVQQGRAPINRPRYNGRNRFNDGVERYDRDFRDRPGVADRQSSDRARTAPYTDRRPNQSAVSRVSPQSKRSMDSRPSDRSITSERRTNQDFRPEPRASDRSQTRRTAPQMRSPEVGRSTESRRSPSIRQNVPGTNRSSTSPSRTVRPSTSSTRPSTRFNNTDRRTEVRKSTSRSVSPQKRASTRSRTSPDVRKKQSSSRASSASRKSSAGRSSTSRRNH